MSNESQGQVGVDSCELSGKKYKSEVQKITWCDAPMTMLFEVDIELCFVHVNFGGEITVECFVTSR